MLSICPGEKQRWFSLPWTTGRKNRLQPSSPSTTKRTAKSTDRSTPLKSTLCERGSAPLICFIRLGLFAPYIRHLYIRTLYVHVFYMLSRYDLPGSCGRLHVSSLD